MTWELIADVESFAAAAGQFLRSRPVEHTIQLTLIDTLRQRGPHAYGPHDPIFGVWRTPGGVDGVLLQTPPHPMLFSALPHDAAAAAVDVLQDRPLSGANLPAADADTFLAGWRHRTGARYTVRMRTRLHRLETFQPPITPPGLARTAGPEDRDLLVSWHTAFLGEIGEARHGDSGAVIDSWIGYGGATLWQDHTPVAMAVRSRPYAGMIRIQAVYTPPEHRSRGYAGAATAQATQQALNLGVQHVVLFTDLANPTSNGLYRRLGYRPVEDHMVVDFSS